MSVIEINPPPEALAVVEQANVSIEVAQNLGASYAGLFQAARSVLEKSRAINVTSVAQKLEMKVAREYRLELKRIRVEADGVRKTLKADVLSRGKAIDGFFNILVDLTGIEEKRLAEAEAFAERVEAERIQARKVERQAKLDALGFDHRFTDLTNMPDADFNSLLVNVQIQHDAKVEAARKAEVERLAMEKAEAEERARREVEEKRIREENARLKAEAEEKERARREVEERKIALGESRQSQIRETFKRVPLLGVGVYGEMSDEVFGEHIAALEAQIAKEKAEEVERARVLEEQRAAAEKAHLEREAVEEANRQERLRLQAIAEVERQKAETARLELEAKQAAERAEMQAKFEAERMAALAPEREKLIAFSNALLALEVPVLESESGRIVAAAITTRVANLAKFIAKEAKLL